jgi:hypothetical protein
MKRLRRPAIGFRGRGLSPRLVVADAEREAAYYNGPDPFLCAHGVPDTLPCKECAEEHLRDECQKDADIDAIEQEEENCES